MDEDDRSLNWAVGTEVLDKMDTDFSMFLFARPSFWEGAGRIFDFGDTMTEYNRSLSGDQADTLAMRADWLAVGADLATAIEETRAELAIAEGETR